jgi:hypothetical protein
MRLEGRRKRWLQKEWPESHCQSQAGISAAYCVYRQNNPPISSEERPQCGAATGSQGLGISQCSTQPRSRPRRGGQSKTLPDKYLLKWRPLTGSAALPASAGKLCSPSSPRCTSDAISDKGVFTRPGSNSTRAKVFACAPKLLRSVGREHFCRGSG